MRKINRLTETNTNLRFNGHQMWRPQLCHASSAQPNSSGAQKVYITHLSTDYPNMTIMTDIALSVLNTLK